MFQRDEEAKVLVNSCINKVDGMEMRVHIEFCATRPQESEKYAVREKNDYN